MYCMTCGTENLDKNNYCTHDGTKLHNHKGKYSKDLSTASFCSSCGSASNDENYCCTCGTSLFSFQKSSLSKEALNPVAPKALKSISLPSVNLKSLKPALLSAVAALLILFLISFTILNLNKAAFQSVLSDELGDFFDIADVAYLVEDSSVSIPKPDPLFGLSDMVMASHLIPPALKMVGSNGLMGEEAIAVKVSIGIILLFLIPLISLFASGVLYRKIGKNMSTSDILLGATSIAVVYGLVLSIISLFSGFSYEVNIAKVLNIDINITYSFIRTFLTGLGFAFLFSLLGMVVSIQPRKTASRMTEIFTYGAEFSKGLFTFFSSLIIFTLILTITFTSTLKQTLLSVGDIGFVGNLLDQSFGIIVAIGAQIGLVVWNLASFGTLTYSKGMDEFSYSILSGIKMKNGSVGADFLELQAYIDSTNIRLYLILAVLLLISLFIWAGFKLAKSQQQTYKSLAMYSFVYSLLISLLTYSAQFSFYADNRLSEVIEMSVGFSVIGTFIRSYILSFLFAYVGIWLAKRRN